jgi:hypothetical protein
MGVSTSMYRDVSEELIQSIRNENTDRIKEILNSSDPEERKRLANIKDKTNSEPVLYLAIRKNYVDIFDALIGASADPTVYYGPNQAMHIAAIHGSSEIAEKLMDSIKPKQNLRNSWPSDLAAKYTHKELALQLDQWERAAGKMVQTVPAMLRGARQQGAFYSSKPEGKRDTVTYKKTKEKG